MPTTAKRAAKLATRPRLPSRVRAPTAPTLGASLLVVLLLVAAAVGAVEVGEDTLSLAGDGVAVELVGNYVPATADTLPALQELDGVLGAATEDFGEHRAVAVLTLTPWTESPPVEPGAAGLRQHLEASASALSGVPGVEVARTFVAREDGAVVVGVLDVRRRDRELATALGFSDADGVRQLGFVAPCRTGLAQLFVFVGLDATDEAVEALASRVPEAMAIEPRPAASIRVPDSGSSTTLLIAVFAVALALVVALRVYGVVHRRRARAAAGRHLGVDPTSPRPQGETPVAPWEDALGDDLGEGRHRPDEHDEPR